MGGTRVRPLLAVCMLATCVSLTACTGQGRPARSGADSAGNTRAPAHTLVLEGQPGYSQSPHDPGLARYAYAHRTTCPSARTSRATGLAVTLRAQWAYRDGRTYLSQVLGSFEKDGGSLSVPFMTFFVAPGGVDWQVARQWSTADADSNRATGAYSTGWTNLGGRSAPSWKLTSPVLFLQVWAYDNAAGQSYCVGSTSLVLAA
jgi:hypothetical protein